MRVLADKTTGLVLLDRYVEAILRRPWLVIALATLFMLIAATGARFITVANDYRILFKEDNPYRIALEALESTYSTFDRALIAVEPREGSIFTREALGAIEELTETAWETPHSSRVDSLTNYTHSRAEGDDLIIEPLVENASALKDADLTRIRKIALDSAELPGRLVSLDERIGGLAITFVLPEDLDAAVIDIGEHLDAVLASARAKYPNITFYLTGDVIFHRAFADATRKDVETLVPLVFLVIVCLTVILLRSFFGALAVVAVILFPVLTTLGFAGWLRVEFSPANSGVPAMIMVIAIADAVHIVSSALLEMKRGQEKKAAIAESLRHNAWPAFLTAVTTAIGFLTLNASDSPPFHVLGNCMAFGVLCAYLYSMTLLPALLSLLPLRIPRVRSESTALFERFADLVIAKRRLLLWVLVLVAAVLLSGIHRIELGDNLTKFFDERYQLRRDTDYISKNLTGFDKLEYSLQSDREGGITDPDYLHKVETFAEWYRKQPNVSHVQAFTGIMKRLNENMHGDDPAFHRLPEDQDLAAQYLLLYEFSLPVGMDLNNRMDIAKSATRLTVTIEDATAQDLRELSERARSWLQANMPDFAQEASGQSILVAHMTHRNLHSMLSTTIFAMAIISGILILVFKSLRLGLLSLVPNFLPALMTFGLWGYLVGGMGIVSSVAVALTFGIIVDDTIYFMSAYLKARRKEGLSPSDAVRYAFRTVGQALWTTTIVLSAGFMVFTVSGFELSWVLGLLVTITVIFALATDFLLLPILLIALDGKNPLRRIREKGPSNSPATVGETT